MLTPAAAFVVLCPGAFFYHSALGLGLIPPVLGGYFSPVATLLLPFLSFAYLREVRRSRRFVTWMDLSFFSFLLYFSFVVALNAIQGADRLIVRTHVAAILGFSGVFLIFRMADFDSGRIQPVLVACLICMSAIVLSHVVNGQFYLRQLGEADNPEAVATYQSFALYYLSTLAVVMASAARVALRLPLYCLCLPVLYLNGARSEFAGFLPAVVALELSRSRLSLPRFLIVLGGFCLLGAAAAGGRWVLDLLPGNRTLELAELGGSTSWESRGALLAAGLRTIAEHPILGDYGSYPPGLYIHNILSSWVDLGLPGFLSLALLVALPVWRLCVDLALRPKRTLAPGFALALLFGVVTVVLLAAAKVFTYIPLAAAAGAYASYRHGLREREREAP